MEHHSNKQSYDVESVSTSLPSSPARTCNNEMLQAIYDRQQAKFHLQIVSNRVSQLKKLKQQAEKEIEKLESKIKKEESSGRWRKNKAEKRRKSCEDNQDYLEYRRKNINKERNERRKSIKDLESKIIADKQTIVKENKQRAKMWAQEKYLNSSLDLDMKTQKYKAIKHGYVKALRNRCLTQRSETQRIKDEYYKSIEDEKQVKLEAFDKISDLEVVEINLIQELSKTVDIRKALLENLSKVKAEYSRING